MHSGETNCCYCLFFFYIFFGYLRAQHGAGGKWVYLLNPLVYFVVVVCSVACFNSAPLAFWQFLGEVNYLFYTLGVLTT